MESLIKKKNIAKIKSRIKSDNGKLGHSCESLHAEKRRRNFQKAPGIDAEHARCRF